MKIHNILLLPEDLANKQPIVLFDGECSLCTRSVRFLLRHNYSGTLRFTSIQSETGSEIIKLAGKTFDKADTLLLVQDNELFGYSTAALKITAHLRFPWHLLKILMIIPPFIRDAFYRIIAKNRYKWFGKESLCQADKKEYQGRFLS